MEAPHAPGVGLGAGTTSDWLEVIPEDLTYEHRADNGQAEVRPLREHPQIREFTSPGELAKAFLETKRLVGQKTVGLRPLAEDASDEDRKAFERELRRVAGVPESPDGYRFGEAPKGLERDEETLAWYRAQAHKAGLSPQQAASLYEGWNAYVVGRVQARHEQASLELSREWGPELLPNVELAHRGFLQAANLAGLERDEVVTAMEQSGMGDHPLMVRLFHGIGRALAEDELIAGGGPPPRKKTPGEVLYPSLAKS
jgi:hypothetical protein